MVRLHRDGEVVVVVKYYSSQLDQNPLYECFCLSCCQRRLYCYDSDLSLYLSRLGYTVKNQDDLADDIAHVNSRSFSISAHSPNCPNLGVVPVINENGSKLTSATQMFRNIAV